MTKKAHRHFDEKAVGPITQVKFTTSKLDDSTAQDMGDELYRLAERPGQTELYLDFADVESLTSTTLGKLIRLHQRVEEAGGRLILKNLNSFLCELFRMTRLDTILEIRLKEPDVPA